MNRNTGSFKSFMLFRLFSSAHFLQIKYLWLFDRHTASPVGGPALVQGSADTHHHPCPSPMTTGLTSHLPHKAGDGEVLPQQHPLTPSPTRMWLPYQRFPCGTYPWEGKTGGVAMETVLPCSIDRAGLFPAFLSPNTLPWSRDNRRTHVALSHNIPMATPAPAPTQLAAASPAHEGLTWWETIYCHSTGASHVWGHKKSSDRLMRVT